MRSLRRFSLLLPLALLTTGVKTAWTTAGTDWVTGDLFVSAGIPPLSSAAPTGQFVVLQADGTPRREVFDQIRRSYTRGCALEPATGFLWAANGDESTISRVNDVHNSRREHEIVQEIDLRRHTFVNGRARGAVQSIVFAASGAAYAGTIAGTNELLKLDPAGAVIGSYTMPAAAPVAWLDLAADQHTIFYTSEDNLVRRYDLATRAPLPTFAELIDGTVHALRLLPNDQGMLVAGSAGVTRLDMNGQYVTRYWLPERQFYALNITPDARGFWTSTQLGELYRFDIASGAVVQGPVMAGFPAITGLCVKHEYTAAENVCRTLGADGQPVVAACPQY
jgi:hypothetical protein